MMPSMAQRLRAFLREIGPGGSRTGAAVLLVVLTLLALALVMILFNLVYAGREAAEQGAGEDQYTIASGPQPEDFPLIFDSEFTPADGRPQEIPGLSEMNVIGYLQYVPGTNFRCLGASPERRLLRRTCLSSSEEDPATYEVTLVEDNPDTVLSVVATARDATDEGAAEVLGDVARLAVGGLDPLDAETWVERTISSGGQYVAEGAEVRLYGTEWGRTLEIVGTAPTPVEDPETTDRILETTEVPPTVRSKARS